jgi:hypothetical protein
VLVVQGDGWTPLIVTSQRGHVEAVRVLLDAGAAVNQALVSGDGRAGGSGVWFVWCGVCVCCCGVGCEG